MDAFLVEARLTGAQSHLTSRHVVVAADAAEAERIAGEALGISEGMRVTETLAPERVREVGVDVGDAGYRGQVPGEP